MWLDQRTRVGRLRVRGAAADSPAVRLAVSGRLQVSELDLPPSAPPSAILLVRHFRDPLPGRFPRRGAPRTDREWDRAARDELDAFFRIASRPRRGRLPANPPAIVFLDPAELVAAAALYLAEGGGERSWWWETLERFLPAGALSGVERLLLAMPRETPAALARLVDDDLAAVVVARLDPPAVEAIVAAVRREFSLPGSPMATEASSGATAGVGATHPPETAPWESWLPPASTASLAAHQVLLLGVALGAARAPGTVRRDDFWRRLARWRRQPMLAPLPRPRPSAGPRDPDAAAARSLRPAADSEDRRWTGAQLVSEPVAGEETDPASVPGTTVATRNRRTSHQDPGSEPRTDSATKALEGQRADASFSPAPGAVAPPAAVPTGTSGSPLPRPLEWGDAPTGSGLGGAFYLLPVMAALDLPDACEPRWGLASRLGGWGTLDTLARALVSPSTENRDDALWRLLALLAGRGPDEPPTLEAAGEPVPRRFKPPDCWPAGPPPLAPLDLGQPLLAGLDPTLLVWLAGALPHVVRFVLGATGLGELREVAELLALECRIFTTSTHVDVVAPLGGISLAARRGGLDRDPGWAPALGRVVQFHFR